MALRLELGGVEEHAVALHPEEHREDAHLDLFIDELEFFILFYLGVKDLVERERAIGVFRSVLGGAADLDRGKFDARRALAGDFVIAEGLPAAMAQGERAQIMTLVHLEDVRLEQRVVRAAGEPEALVGEHMAVELDVLADLLHSGVG